MLKRLERRCDTNKATTVANACSIARSLNDGINYRRADDDLFFLSLICSLIFDLEESKEKATHIQHTRTPQYKQKMNSSKPQVSTTSVVSLPPVTAGAASSTSSAGESSDGEQATSTTTTTTHRAPNELIQEVVCEKFLLFIVIA